MPVVSAPVDATQTPEWAALVEHQKEIAAKFTLKNAFADDPNRVSKFSHDMGELHFDFSKNLITEKTLELLLDLARAVHVEERRDAMLAGEHVNTTEDRAVLHSALRAPESDRGSLKVDGQDVVGDVRDVLNRMYAFADKVRSGAWTGVTGKKIEHVVSIGIGGSDLGPVMVYEGLKPFANAGIDCTYVSNIDPNDIAEKLRPLDPETTLMIVVSKTFTTLENNVPALMGMINVWYSNFWHTETHAVLPYNQYMHRFPAYLQQLTMESNGKSVRWDGSPVSCDTGEIFWGEPGTNGQHSFYQLIHQGTRMIPADFIAFVNTENPLKDGDQDTHELLLGNFLAQTKALAFGKTADEVRAEGTPEPIVPARCFAGNKPSTSILGTALTPHSLGALVALYEYIVFVEGTVWGVDSFDQWGVELGKQLAREITVAFHDDEALAEQDASTQALIAFYHEHRA